MKNTNRFAACLPVGAIGKSLPGLLLAGLLLGSSALAQDADKPPKIFTTDEVIAITLEGPWRTIERNKDSGETWSGMARYTSASGQEVSIPIDIRTRGLTRKRVCDFPPLRIGFDKEASKGTEFRGAGNLKMVTHCLNREKYEEYYVKEYLAYRFYNALTDKSYRVQGLDVSYYDNERNEKTRDRFGFLIEDPDDVAERNGLIKIEIEEAKLKELDPEATAQHALFQFLIANLDWSVLSGPDDRCCHNMRMAGAAVGQPPYYPLPYDLDSSGFVDAHYAAPPQGLKVRTVRQRLYRGFCRHNDQVPAALQRFRDLRPTFESLINNEPRLSARGKKSALKFIEDFYEDLEDERDVQKELIDNCRG